MFAAVHLGSHAMLEVSFHLAKFLSKRACSLMVRNQPYVATLRSWAMSQNEVITELESRVLQFISSPYDKAYKTSRGLGDKDIPKEKKDHTNPTPTYGENAFFKMEYD